MASSPYDIALNSNVIHQIKNLNHKTNGQAVPGFASGNVRPSAMYLGESPHKTQFQSSDLGTILALNSGTLITAGLCTYGAVSTIPFRKRVDCGTYASGNTHDAIQCSNTLLIPDSISAKVGAEAAMLDATLYYKSASGGFVSPVSVVSSASLSDPTFVGEYLLHSVLINGVLIPELQGVDVQTGLKVTEQKSSGVYVTGLFITEGLPSISIQTENVAYANSVINGAGLGSGITIFLAKRKDGAVAEDEAEEVHIAISGAVGLGQAETIGGESNSNSNNTVKINPLQLVATVGVAIA
jgi:hypothetical protein